MSKAGSRNELPGFVAVVGLLAVAAALALTELDRAAAAALGLSVAAEWLLEARSPTIATTLRQAGFGPPTRFLVRVALALLAASRFDDTTALHVFLAMALLEASLLCLRSLHVEYREVGPLKPLRTRHIPGNPSIVAAPPAHPVATTISELLVIVPALVGASWEVVGALGAVGVALIAAVSIPDALTSWRMRSAKRATGFTPQLGRVQEFLDEYRPEVAVHVSGPAAAAYQINMWLETLETLDRKVILVVRDAPLFERMSKSSLPTIGLADAGDLLMLDFSSVRVALFPSNTGNNIHMLRLPHIMSAFIGHGDSDKSASNNPFSRTYDELWVAGEAGADRYRRSGLGIHDDQFRFVGRPQVHAIERAAESPPVPTVLYAPTWEGVNRQQEYSSLAAIGPRIVEALLDAGDIRIIYKPHPFTGDRDAKYRAAHTRIVELIEAARIKTNLGHRVVQRGAIIPWFNESTALISDISSVLSDYLASEKPYAVFNHTGRWVPPVETRDFRETYPSSAAATIIDGSGNGIDEFIAIVRGRADDTLADYRSRLASYLLGEREQRSISAFHGAIIDFIDRSERERARYR